ncbi:MAG: AMP-binding protein, partial [Terriglobia bacterium]
LDGIGTTEMLHMFISNRPGRARPGSCGQVVPGYRARIVTESGAEAAAEEVGNLWVAGGSAFAGYWGKPELTARVKQGEWVITGDKFFRDAEGFYHYCGRADDMLKVSGLWVSPVEVENTLLAHPGVAEAAVVGQRNAEGLTRIVAHVVLRESAPGGEGLTEELRTFAKARLPGYKCPQAVHYIDALPKTATGKIQRFKLRN